MTKIPTIKQIKIKKANSDLKRKNKLQDAKIEIKIWEMKRNFLIKTILFPIILLIIYYLISLGYIDPALTILFHLFDKFYK